jgi:hypothetical protein
MKEAYTLAIGCVIGLVIGMPVGMAILATAQPPTESICTMDGEQAREFARQCKATGGELSIYEYTCKQTDN